MMQSRRASSKSSILLWNICVVCLSINIIKVSCIHTLKQGDTLNSSSQLKSPNGHFSLRFYTPQEKNEASYIAVLFDPRGPDSPFETPTIWIGNRDDPIPTNSAPLLTLGMRGELLITRSDGGDPIQLYAGVGSQRSIINTTAALSDTGNFMVHGSNGEVLWQSYDHPTDTLLPGMKLGANSKITSWLTPSDPASGAFTLEWDPGAGELVIRRRGMAYWRSGQLRDNSNFHDSFNYHNLSDAGDYFMYTGSSSEYRKVNSGWRVDWTGNVTSTDDSGTTIIMAMASVCYGYRGEVGCEVWEQPRCRNGHQTFVRKSGEFVDARNGRGVYDPTLANESSRLGLSDCRDFCWRNCGCAGYSSFIGKDYGCSYWIGKHLVWAQDDEGRSLVKYVVQSSGKGKKKHLGVILGVVSLLVLLILGLAYFIMRKLKVRREEQLHQLLTLEGYTESYKLENRGAKNHNLKLFSYASILSATSNFSSSNKLGQGGFGPVYKGRTAGGQDIAVKLLSRQSGQGLLEFKNELILISELQHVNLVKLVGFCIHRDDKMIIYDYMPNKSLDCFLFSPSKREQLDWKKRFNIIEGTAQGLLYLHKHSRLRIIHRDMKPNNILLDENMNPKISDFGLARIFKDDASEVNTDRRVGTLGYMAPEYAMQGLFSVKSDVYSFGVLVLEIVSGRKNSSFHKIEGPLNIVEYAWELWRKDRALELMDPVLKDSCIIDQLRKCIHIGLLCVENHAVDRPTIEDVLLMLKNETTTLPMTTNPAFIARNTMLQQVEKSSTLSNE